MVGVIRELIRLSYERTVLGLSAGSTASSQTLAQSLREIRPSAGSTHSPLALETSELAVNARPLCGCGRPYFARLRPAPELGRPTPIARPRTRGIDGSPAARPSGTPVSSICAGCGTQLSFDLRPCSTTLSVSWLAARHSPSEL